MFNVFDVRDFNLMLQDVYNISKKVEVIGVPVSKELVVPENIIVVGSDAAHWSPERKVVELPQQLLDGDNRVIVSVVAHELTHAQQRNHAATYQNFDGWERMYRYARCAKEWQANVVGLICVALWDAREEGHLIDYNDPKIDRLVDKMKIYQNEKIKAAQEELLRLKGADVQTLKQAAQRLCLSWRSPRG